MLNTILNFLYWSPLETYETADIDWLSISIDEGIATIALTLILIYTTDFISELDDTIDSEEDDDIFDDFSAELNDEMMLDNLNDLEDDELSEILYSTFGLILSSNLLNLLPYNDSSTSSIGFTLFMSASIFLALNLNGILIHSFAMVKLFLPQGVPSFLTPILFVIEVISYFARLFSLGIRLFANMMSGHILIAILSTFAVILFLNVSFSSFAAFFLILVIIAIYFLECIISYLQAYVFGMLITIYYGDALNLHH